MNTALVLIVYLFQPNDVAAFTGNRKGRNQDSIYRRANYIDENVALALSMSATTAYK